MPDPKGGNTSLAVATATKHTKKESCICMQANLQHIRKIRLITEKIEGRILKLETKTD